MKRSLFHFDLPEDLIAQHPAPERDGARLLVVDAATGAWQHRAIRDLPDLLPPEALCVPNDVKVRHARLQLRRAGGGAGEALLLRAFADGLPAPAAAGTLGGQRRGLSQSGWGGGAGDPEPAGVAERGEPGGRRAAP